MRQRKVLSRSAKLLAAAATATIATMLPVAGVAHADNGDNGPGCASGEICFWYDQRDFYQKQFWYSSNHGGINFMYYNGYKYYESDEPLQDNALQATNRDTECSVRVGHLHDGFWTYRTLPNDKVRYHLGAVNNKNDRHDRCA